MDAIVLFSHGSVLCGSEKNLLGLAARMRERGDAPVVEVGFLNYSQPSFARAVASCAAQGATRIVIAPYFLVPGKFVVRDLPGAISAVREEHPGIEFVTAEVIGFHPLLAEAILASADAARSPELWHERLDDVSESCREDPNCPMYGSEFCRVRVEATS